METSAAKHLRDDDDAARLTKRDGAPVVGRALVAAALVESLEAQLALVLLLALDVCCAALTLLIDPLAPLAPLLEALGGFALVAFVLELALLLATFRGQFFAHAGYALDTTVVIAAIAYELYAHSKALRLLGVLRLWRVVRVVNTLVERERRAHDATRDAFEREQLRALQLGAEKLAAQESLRREYESRGGLERLLQSYKDEAETLKEALQIAAEAVAEAELRAGETDYEGYKAYEYQGGEKAEASRGESDPFAEFDSAKSTSEPEAVAEALPPATEPPAKTRDVEQRAVEVAAADEFQDAVPF